MHRKYFFFILALAMVCLFLIMTFFAQKPVPPPQTNIQAVHSPFHGSIHGVGIVEPASGNIYVGIPFNRIVKKINVSVNDHVKKDEVLLELDNQDLLASYQVKKREYEKALANLQKLESLPREEDLAIAEEALKKAQISVNEARTLYGMVERLSNPGAISKEERDKRQYNYEQAVAELRESEAQFEKIKSGTWHPDLKIASAEVEQAKADVDSIETEIQRTYIKSPIDGTVLQIKIHEGETSEPDTSKTIIVGNIDELFLRVSIDQFNVSILDPKVPAVAYRQGEDNATAFPLKFVHVEPFMVPKKYLTNAVDEKVDTQVFEILYRIEKKDSPLFIGEQMDVYIDTKEK